VNCTFAANSYPAITPWDCIATEFAGALLTYRRCSVMAPHAAVPSPALRMDAPKHA
jgi:hypothetical protein